ncbi:MAG TPA: ABC transporter permease [Gemmatimonadaceae bacterium]|nr:ABC transporter permease [Gemmatimonadaceae bacterium]
MNRIAQDIRFAWRSVIKNPAFSLIVAACVAIGIAVNTTIFSVTDAIVLRPFDFQDPEQIVLVSSRDEKSGDDEGVSYLNFKDWKRESPSFSAMAAYGYRSLAITDGEEPERLEGNVISWDLFHLLGNKPQLGRLFLPEEDRPGAPGVVLLSDEVWQRRYHGDSAIVGQTIQVNALPHTVVGVMPPKFKFPQEAQLWIPIAGLAEQDKRDWRNFQVIARLKPNVTSDQASRDLATVSRRVNEQTGMGPNAWIGTTNPIRKELIPDDVKLVVLAMMGAVTLVLLVACANVANLMLARASARQREIAIRAAIGAGRAAIVRQLLVESLLLAVIGAAIAIPLAYLGLNLLDAAMPAEDPIPYYIDWRIDARTLVYTLGIALVTGVIFGLTPALQATSGKLYGVLKEGGRGSGSGVKKNRMRASLVVAEVALSVILLVGASLFVRSFLGMRQANVGFATDPLMTMRFYLPGTQYDSTSAKVQRVEDVLRRIEAIPGVQAAAVSNLIPLDGGGSYSPVEIEGQRYDTENRPSIFWSGVTAHWLQTLGIQLLAGRNMTEAEAMDSAEVAVVTQAFARRFWKDGDALGHRFRIVGDSAARYFTIIGVMAEFRWADLDDTDEPDGAAFVPYPYMFARNNGLIVRAAGSPVNLTNAIREQIRASDAKVPVFSTMTMNDVRRLSYWQYGLFGWMFGIFGVIALILAAIGVYGVISFGVSQRTQEIGVRVALGASRRDVLRMVVMHGMVLAAAGILIGAVGAFGVTRVVRSLLINVSPTDPLSFGWVAVFLAVIVAVASYFPARRATAVDPIVALRSE